MKKIIYSFALAAFAIGAAFTSNASRTGNYTAGPMNSESPECILQPLDCNPIQNTHPACTVGNVSQYRFDTGAEKCVTPLYKDNAS